MNNGHASMNIKCKCCFSVDIMKLYISALGNARKLKFTSYVQLQPINTMVEYCCA